MERDFYFEDIFSAGKRILRDKAYPEHTSKHVKTLEYVPQTLLEEFKSLQ